ncbi:hypothetical protein AAF712_003722 [Marasmius tenuissimus]|uniref:Chromo domain-containing protein n=1 Tax=Marasmius tenuissimus TaxID=585030 RepID=A0ABR3AA07_9AGAR
MSPGLMAPSDNDTSLEISDLETQFVPQEDDNETLYRVIEITKERPKEYQVRWAGNNPKTKKPWDLSWVKKSDCTHDLVVEWKKKKARIRASAANTPISGRSKASGSRSKSIESPSANTKRSRLKQLSAEKDAVWDEPPAGPSVVIKKRKKIGSSRNSPSVSRPNKRRKTKAVEQTIVEENFSSDIEEDRKAPSIQASSRRGSQANSSQSEGEESTVKPNTKRNKGKGKAVDDEEDRRSKSSGSTRRGSSTTGHKGKKRASTEEDYNGDVGHESDASSTSDHSRPRAIVKTKQRSRQIIASSQENGPSPPSPSFGEPYLLQNVENDHVDVPDEDRAHGTTTREVDVSASCERRSEDRSGDEANVPYEARFVKFPPRSGRRRSNERSSVPTLAANTRQTSHTPPSPLLSPGSLARLREFDDFCQALEEEEKRPDTETDQSPKKIPSEYLARRGTSEDDNEPVPSPSPPASKVNSPRSSPPMVANKPAPPPSPTRAKRPSDPDDSFEIVPETETQSSTNTQHRSPERATVVSKMKPRTPSRGNSMQQPRRSASNEGIEAGRSSRERSLKPVPAVSPSTFAPYLSSAHVDSDSETDGDDGVNDTIEQFSSPEKGGESKKLASRLQKQKQAEKDRQDHDRLYEKGLAMYDKARRERAMVQNGGQAKKRSLSDLLKPPSPSESSSPEAIEETWDDHLIPEEPVNMDLDMSLPNPQYPSSGTEKDSPVVSKRVNGSNGSEHPPVVSEQQPSVPTMAESVLRELSEKRGEDLQTALAEISRLEELISAERSQTAALLREREDNLTARSERIAALEKEMATERAENVARIATLEEALAARAAPPEAPQVDATAIEELKATVQKAAADKKSLEKDRDFFREEWSKASGHVTLVSAENAELKQRAQIAETRATDGLAMVRATFEARVKFLEGNAKEAQRLANFVMEKDQRTNDVIRSRAAQYPELKRELDELKESSKMTSEEQDLQIEELENSLATSKKREEAWKAEVLRLSEDLNAHKAQRIREGMVNNNVPSFFKHVR